MPSMSKLPLKIYYRLSSHFSISGHVIPMTEWWCLRNSRWHICKKIFLQIGLSWLVKKILLTESKGMSKNSEDFSKTKTEVKVGQHAMKRVIIFVKRMNKKEKKQAYTWKETWFLSEGQAKRRENKPTQSPYWKMSWSANTSRDRLVIKACVDI